MIEAVSLYGKKIKIPKGKFKIRVSVYGIIINDGEILLINTKSTGKFYFPGGGVEIGEKIEEALKRELHEETGIRIEIEEFITFTEVFFYYDPWDEGFQNYSFFYQCKPLTLKLSENQMEHDEAEKPQWVKISSLKKEDFQPTAYETLQLILKK